VSHIDVVPTILALLGDPLSSGLPGRPLPLIATAQADSARLLLSEGPGCGAFRTWIDSTLWKLAFNRRKPDEPAQLYDLTSDPQELRDVASEHPELTQELTNRLLTVLTESIRGSLPAVTLDPSTIEELKSLGYIGGGDGHAHEEVQRK
jgi:arylsulfatase A-like enzyme